MLVLSSQHSTVGNMQPQEDWCPEWVKLNEQLAATLGGAMESTRVEIITSPEKALVCLFLGKAYKTHQAITKLARSGFGEDAAILARSLLNLVINALWIHQNPSVRVSAYIDFDTVLRARLGRKIIQNPSLLGSQFQNRLSGIKSTQPQLEAEEKKAITKHGYKRGVWSGKTIRDMAEDVGHINAYDSAYTLMSNLEHSNATSTDAYITEGPDGLTIGVAPGPNYVRESLATAHHLLLLIARLADRILELGIATELKEAEARELGLV